MLMHLFEFLVFSIVVHFEFLSSYVALFEFCCVFIVTQFEFLVGFSFCVTN